MHPLEFIRCDLGCRGKGQWGRTTLYYQEDNGEVEQLRACRAADDQAECLEDHMMADILGLDGRVTSKECDTPSFFIMTTNIL